MQLKPTEMNRQNCCLKQTKKKQTHFETEKVVDKDKKTAAANVAVNEVLSFQVRCLVCLVCLV